MIQQQAARVSTYLQLFLLAAPACSALVAGWAEYYDYLMSLGDKRVETWGLMASPLPTIAITIAYLLSE